MELTLQQLRILDAIERQGSAGGAARELRLTQPAISRALAAAEEHLGCALFARHGRGMRPTTAGVRAAETARLVIRTVERLRFDLEGLRHKRHGRLRVATQCYTCYQWLPAVVQRFHSEFPGFDIEIVPEATYETLDAIQEGRVDVALTDMPIDVLRFHRWPLFRDEFVAVLPPGHPLGETERLEPSDFADQTVLLHSDRSRSTLINAFLRPAGVEPARVSRLPLTEAVLEMVRAGLGVTAMAAWAVADELAAGRLVARPLGTGLFQDWSLTARAEQANDPVLAAFARLLAQEPTLRNAS